MNRTITIGEFILITTVCILGFAFVKTIIETIKDKFNA